MATLYNVISSDGFIARTDGSEDFIPDNLWINFLNLCQEYGVVVMGRNTYETIQSYPEELREPFENLPIKKIVITHTESYEVKTGYEIARSPAEVLARYPDALVTSGPTLNDFLLAKKLIKKIIFHEVPVSIGSGIKPFDDSFATLVPVENVTQLEGVKVRGYTVV